jgi:hypothetical protein
MRNYRVEFLTPDALVELPSILGGLGVSSIVLATVPNTHVHPAATLTTASSSEAQSFVLDAPVHPPTTPPPSDSMPAMHTPDISTSTTLTASGVATLQETMKCSSVITNEHSF